MENEILNLFLDNIHFEYNRNQKELRIPTFKNSRIPIDVITLHDGHYRFFIECDESNLKFSCRANYFADCPEGMTQITIPKIVFEGSQEEALAMNRSSHQKGWNFYIADDAVMERLKGKLPTIDIAGDKYFVDWKLKELRHTKNLYRRICINPLEVTPDRKSYRVLFNKHTKRAADPLVGNENPEHMVYVDIPPEFKLDPVAHAREQGLKDTALLHRFPIEKELKAKITELNSMQKSQLKEFLEYVQATNHVAKKNVRGRKMR